MLRLSYVVLAVMFLGALIYLGSCVSGGMLDPTDPILPSPELKEGTVDPKTRAISITKEGVTVTVQHWSRYRLNQKYTTATMRSPFYYLETWEQGYQWDAFQVTIKNDTPRGVVVNFKETNMTDERKYTYRPVDAGVVRDKFVTKEMMDMKTKNTLAMVPQLLLNEMLAQGRKVKSGETVSGFLGFNVPSSQATKLSVTLILEKEPELKTAAYEKVEFKYDYIQDLILRVKQPVVRR